MASKFYRFKTGVTSTGFKKRVLSSKQGAQESWSLWICLYSDGEDVSPIQTIDVNAADEADALRISLDYIKRVVRGLRKRVLLTVHLFPPEGKTTKQMFRLKAGYCNRRLLRLQNPLVCFYRGYGHEIAELN